TARGVVFDISVGRGAAPVRPRFRCAPATPDTTLRPPVSAWCAPRRPTREAWWARQDSNLQPDRYERRTSLNHASQMLSFVEFRVGSFAFISVISGAKQGR